MVTVHVNNGMNLLREITPGAGCYMNEADYLEGDWQTALFGNNYGACWVLRISMILLTSLNARNLLGGLGLISKFLDYRVEIGC